MTDVTKDIEQAAEAPDDVDENQFTDWIEAEADGLQDFLEEMSSVYHEDDERINVHFAKMAAAISDTDVSINPMMPDMFDDPVQGANILRILDDTLAHEIAHLNWSPLEDKKRFSECYPGWGKVPGFVANYMEDAYVNEKRKNIWYGMRSKQAYKIWLAMNTDSVRPPVNVVEDEESRTNALLETICHLAYAGYVKGLDEASSDIKEFSVYADRLLARVRTQDDPDQRFKLFHAMMQLLIRYAPDPDEFDDDAAEDRMDDAHGVNPDSAHQVEQAPRSVGAPEVDLPPDVRQALEDIIEELMEDGEFPNPEAGEEDGGDPFDDFDLPEPESAPPDEGASGGTEGPDDTPEGESETGGSGGSPENGPDGELAEGESGGDDPPSPAPPDSDTDGMIRDVQSVLDKYRDKKLVVRN